MTTRFHVLSIFLSLGASLVQGALLEGDRERIALQTVDDMINCRFVQATASADLLTVSDSLDPLGPLLKLLSMGLRELDLDLSVDTARFQDGYLETVSRIRKAEEAQGRSSYLLTMAGIANASHASYYLRQKRYFPAIGTGLDGLKLLEEARGLDSTNVDADFFLGLYDYARGELRKRLWMVLFWYPGDKDRGIARLQACATGGQLAATGARMALADIYTQEKEYERADKVIRGLRAQYPESRFVMWSQAKYYETRKEYAAAAITYGMLAASYGEVKHGTYNALVTRHRQIELLLEAGDYKQAALLARAALKEDCRGHDKRCREVCDRIRRSVRRVDDDR